MEGMETRSDVLEVDVENATCVAVLAGVDHQETVMAGKKRDAREVRGRQGGNVEFLVDSGRESLRHTGEVRTLLLVAL